jgi:hypothetical protein
MDKIDKLKEQIDLLDSKVDALIDKFDRKWFKTYNPFSEKTFDQYNKERNDYCQPHLEELIKLKLEYRLTKPYKLEPVPDYGDVMSLIDFIDCVKEGGFIDYDGYGRYIINNYMTDIEIYPTDVKNNYLRKEFDTIIWFNR